MSRFARRRALATFEVRQQLREPLTALYALVFLLLTVGFTSAGGVELVSGRGEVPRTSDWSIWLAFGGLTAFGQVITTMVAVTALLRDDATRMTDLIATAGVPAREWLVSRLGAAFAVLMLVYLAMPVGAGVGAWLGAGPGGELLATPSPVVRRIGTAYLVLTVPTMCVVATLLGVTAALTRRVLAALAVALLLVGLWQLALALEARETTRVAGALLDPFGNAPVLAVTHGWDATARRLTPVPLGGLVVANRLVWLGISGLVGAIGIWRVRWPVGDERGASPVPAREASDASHVVATGPTSALTSAPQASVHGQTSPFAAMSRFTAAWIRRDGGWRVVTWLAAANALLNACFRMPADDPSGVTTMTLVALLDLVREHARVFLILLATVYAGELVWRDRDARVSELVDVLPLPSRTMAWARVFGLAMLHWRVIGLLAGGAALIAAWRGLFGGPADWLTWGVWAVLHLWAPFLQWTVLSLAVHVIVRHKVGAHLLLISGWVFAVVLDRQGASAWWYRYAEPAPLMEGSGFAWFEVLQRGGVWMLVAALLLLLIARRWPRGTAWGQRSA